MSWELAIVGTYLGIAFILILIVAVLHPKHKLLSPLKTFLIFSAILLCIVSVNAINPMMEIAQERMNVFGSMFINTTQGKISANESFSNVGNFSNLEINDTPLVELFNGSGGTSDHAALTNLEWSVAGHSIDTDLDLQNYSLLNVKEIYGNRTYISIGGVTTTHGAFVGNDDTLVADKFMSISQSIFYGAKIPTNSELALGDITWAKLSHCTTGACAGSINWWINETIPLVIDVPNATFTGKVYINENAAVSTTLLTLESDINNNNEYNEILFKIAGGVNYGAVRSHVGATAGNSYMSFYTTTDGGTLVRQMTIQHNGYVGIGTVNPGERLDVVGTAKIDSLTIDAQATDFSMNSHKITSVTDPTANQDAATKKYVDDNEASPTKEFFIPVDWGEGGARQGSTGDFHHWNLPVDVANDAFISFYIPADFTSVVSADVVVIIGGMADPATIVYSIDTDFGAVGENYATHSTSVAFQPFLTSSDNIEELPITTTGMAAGDYVGVEISNLGITIGGNVDFDVLGVRFRYS